MQTSFTVSEIIESGGFRKPLMKIIALCFLLMVCDSFDVSALSYAAPVLIKNLGLSGSSMGILFSAGLFGLLVGSVIFGRIGDRLGRKRAIVIGALAFSILTAATGFASTYSELLVLRFLATLGLGGAVPNAVALITEFSPKRLRITAVGAIFAGYSVGGIIAGLIAAYVIPTYGWPMMFFVGGALSLLSAVAFVFLLPESLSFLAGQPSRTSDGRRVAALLRPDLPIGPNSLITPDAPRALVVGHLADLFAGPLRIATPLMWLIYIANSMTVFFLSSWMPFAVEAIGLSRGTAALATALLFTGSAVGGVIGGRFADRFGIAAVVIMAIIACPIVGSIGLLKGAAVLIFPVSFLAGCFAFGAQTCLHGVVGSLYPTRVKANGVGWAIGIAKIGSILGPFIGGLILPQVSSQVLFLAAATPLIVVAVLAFLLKVYLASAGENDRTTSAPVPIAN